MFLAPGAIDTSAVRPSRLTPDKNKEYHTLFARWCIGGAFGTSLNAFYMKTMVNWNFYRGNQWLYNEDLAAFLMDESGDVRNRIKFVENIIRPMVEQYVGNAIRTDFTFRAQSVNETVLNRREVQLQKLKTLTRLSQDTAPQFAEMLKENFPIGQDTNETETMFNNYYVDDYEKAINNLIRYISTKNDFEKLKVEATKHLAISGLMVLKDYVQGGEMMWKVQDPLYFFFDRGAKRPDLKDAEYMGSYQYMLPTDIFERFETLTGQEREAIEDYAKSQKYQNSQYTGAFMESLRGRVPVYEVYWKDTEKQEYGYVYDQFGYEFFTQINGPNGQYSGGDVIFPNDQERRDKMGGKLIKTIYVDTLRYAIFIPKEELGVKGEDIMLEYGMDPYGETYLYDPSNIEFPFKCYCWSYHNGYIQSPIDDAIDPQRYINRLLSVAESQINNSRGSGSIIDKDMVDPQGGEEEILRNMNNSKPIFVQAKGNLNNSISAYDSTIGTGTQMLFSIVGQMRELVQNVTGINEAMQGASGGQRELVGVVNAQLQRGTLIQEPFYYTIGEMLKQCYQSMAQKGKRIYAANQRRLAIITGDDKAEQLIITKDFMMEDFRVFVKRTPPEVDMVAEGNMMALNLLTQGIIDHETFSKIYGISSPDQVARALREYGKMQVEVQRKEAQAQTEAEGKQILAEEASMQMEGEAANAQVALDMENKEADRQNKLQQIQLKESMKNQGNK
jgi:hypothetical protein